MQNLCVFIIDKRGDDFILVFDEEPSKFIQSVNPCIAVKHEISIQKKKKPAYTKKHSISKGFALDLFKIVRYN